MHLGRVLEMAESSPDKTAYEKRVGERFRLQQQLELPILIPAPQPNQANSEAAN
jgi:hypothetical protein